jgi:hypothetical protein
MRLLMLLASASLLCGCAAQSGVVDMGGGQYFVSRQAATGIGGMGNLRADALREASAYCAAQSKRLEVVTVEEPPGPYILGKYPRSDITFHCV